MADDKQQTSEQVEATKPEPTAPEPTPAKVQGYNYETGEFVR